MKPLLLAEKLAGLGEEVSTVGKGLKTVTMPKLICLDIFFVLCLYQSRSTIISFCPKRTRRCFTCPSVLAVAFPLVPFTSAICAAMCGATAILPKVMVALAVPAKALAAKLSLPFRTDGAGYAKKGSIVKFSYFYNSGGKYESQ